MLSLASLCACLTTVLSQTPSLTVDRAVAIGLSHNPQALAAKAGTESAQATYRSQAAFPPITFAATHVQGTSTAPTINGTNNDTFLDLGESIDTSGQKRFGAAAANEQYKAARNQQLETSLSLEQQIRDAYWSLAAAKAQSSISQESLKEAERVYNLTVQQEQAGVAPKGDVIRSSIDVANVKQALLSSQNAERTALLTFNNLLGFPPSQEERLADQLEDANIQVPTAQLPSQDDLANAVLKTRPLLLAAVNQTQAANFSVRQAQAARFPDVSVDYQKSVKDQFHTLLLGASFPLLDFGSVHQAVRAAEKTRDQAKAQETQTRQQVQQQVAQAYADFQTALDAATSYKKEILDPSVNLLSMAQLGYQQGATGILSVIDAESTLRDARTGFINALLAIYKAQDELLAATGTLVPLNDK